MNSNKPLSEYPRPQLERDSYLCLNGVWEYAIRQEAEIPSTFDGDILVPYSPETPLSGVNKKVSPKDYLFYRLRFVLPPEFIKDEIILHFTAVDQIADVYLNDVHLGKHIGGYLPFEFKIKKHLKEINTLVVRVQDLTDTSYHSRGKQKIERGGIWYTPQSGIYMPVWMESVPKDYVQSIKLTPDIDHQKLKIKVKSTAKTVYFELNSKKIGIPTNVECDIKIDEMHLWSPESPYLYHFTISTGTETVKSYFAMRKISIITNENKQKIITLNNEPYFMRGVLDQGYYPGGLLTPSCYDDYIKDIKLMKDMGFNTIRKHIKIEPLRWYYECDKMGMLVWQDFVNAGESYIYQVVTWPVITNIHISDRLHGLLRRRNAEGRKETLQEFKDTIKYLYNVPCIVLWTIFNEGWGQFDSKDVYKAIRPLDTTRLYDHASGWHDQGISDVKSMHVYFHRAKMPPKRKVKNRAIVISEIGAFIYPIEGHMMVGKNVYNVYDSYDKWLKEYTDFINLDIVENIPKGLCAFIYTQLSDVEEELNGLITYDREVIKAPIDAIRELNEKAKY